MKMTPTRGRVSRILRETFLRPVETLLLRKLLGSSHYPYLVDRFLFVSSSHTTFFFRVSLASM